MTMAECIFQKQPQQHFHIWRTFQNHATLKLMSPALDTCLTFPTISTEQNQKEHNTTDCLLWADVILNYKQSPVSAAWVIAGPTHTLGWATVERHNLLIIFWGATHNTHKNKQVFSKTPRDLSSNLSDYISHTGSLKKSIMSTRENNNIGKKPQYK